MSYETLRKENDSLRRESDSLGKALRQCTERYERLRTLAEHVVRDYEAERETNPLGVPHSVARYRQFFGKPAEKGNDGAKYST